MLSFNQQGVNMNVEGSFTDHAEFWETDNQTHRDPARESINTYYQQWAQQDQLAQQPKNEISNSSQNHKNFIPQFLHTDVGIQTGLYQDWRQNPTTIVHLIPNHCSPYIEPANINHADNFNQTSQVLLQSHLSPASSSISRFSAVARSHHAQISLVPTSTGSFKTIVKRKRKRTMFKTEQIEVLETVFAKKPYICREDRQVLASQLQVSDNVVKVWFQNRRIREKKDNDEAQLYSSPSEESSCCSAHLDYLESKISQNTDESGFVTLDDIALGEIVNVIDTVLTDKIDFGLKQRSNSQFDCTAKSATSDQSPSSFLLQEPKVDVHLSEPLEGTSNEVEESAVESEGSTYAGSIYEPISPAVSEDMEEEESPRWKPFAADQSLQRLFDLHFC